jgi:hypothetical protein
MTSVQEDVDFAPVSANRRLLSVHLRGRLVRHLANALLDGRRTVDAIELFRPLRLHRKRRSVALAAIAAALIGVPDELKALVRRGKEVCG